MAKGDQKGESPTLVEVALVVGGAMGVVGGFLVGDVIGAGTIVSLLLAGVGGVVGCAAGPLTVLGFMVLIAATFRDR